MQNCILVNIENKRNKLLGLDEKARMLVPIFEEHNRKMEALVGQEFSANTLIRYKTSIKQTIEFLQ